MEFASSDALNEEFSDEEDAEGEPYDSYSDEESGEEINEAEEEEEDYEVSPKGKGKDRDLGEAVDAEPEVDQDFDRLVHDIRSGDAAAGTLSKVWDFDMRDHEAEFKDDLREASGVGKKRGRKPGRRKGIILSQQVRALIGEGNQAYVDDNIPKTIRIMQEVIRIEPRAGSAWSVLAQCHEDTGEVQKALQLRIMAAHLNQDPEEWYRLADQSRQLGYHQQALYCYRKLYQLDSSNITALWDRASLAREIGDLRTARQAFLAILKHVPYDLSVLAELRPILIELSDLNLCASLFQEAFDHYQTVFPSGQTPTLTPSESAVFGLMEILVLADLYNTLGKYDQAVRTIRQGCRWMQGRAAQKFWDTIEDDREWDIPVDSEGESARIVGEGEVQPGMYPLDVNARHRLAIGRIKMGDVPEGKMHANIVLEQDVTEYAPLFSEIADAYYERDMYAEAGNIYEMLGADAGTSSLYVLLQTASCRRELGDVKEAAEVYEHVIQADPTHNEAKMKLAEIYEKTEPRKALDLVLQVIDSRRRTKTSTQEGGEGRSGTAPGGASLFEETARGGKETAGRTGTHKTTKLTVTQLKELEAQKEREAIMSYNRVKAQWALMLAGQAEAEAEWMHEAGLLVESFRETRALFLTTRHVGFRGMFPRSRKPKQSDEANEDSMASRLQLELGRDSLARKSKADGVPIQTLDSFRKISFDDWLRLFMQYTFNLTKKDQYNDAQDMLRHIMYSNAFQKRRYQDTIRCALITCSVAAGHPEIVVEQSRKLINTHQYNNEPFRILLASLGSGLHNTDAFLASTLTKHLLREVRGIDTALKSPESLKWNSVVKRYGAGGKVEDDEEDVGAEPSPSAQDAIDTQARPRLPTKENPVGVALYGQICLAAKSYQSALFYLLHAYDYCSEDPIICLCLAIASIGRAMQRQADNRHHLITQGLTFLSRYRSLRGQDASSCDEVEFNFGRAFHQLGLFTLAEKHYTRALENVEQRVKVDPLDVGVAREAAYNLATIYVMTGATPLAQALYRKWLSL